MWAENVWPVRALSAIPETRPLSGRGERATSLLRFNPCADFKAPQEDLSPQDLETTFFAFLAEAHRLKRKYAPQIDLLVGLETDYITPLDLDSLEKLLETEHERIEYVVGSVHHVAEQGIDFSKEWWQACLAGFEPSSSSPPSTPDALFSDSAITGYLRAYLDAQHSLLTRIQPPVIGHFDLCRLYAPDLPLSDASRFPGVWDAVIRNIREVVSYGGLFEVNAASFRKGWDDAYPGKEILQVRSPLSAKFSAQQAAHLASHTVHRLPKRPPMPLG